MACCERKEELKNVKRKEVKDWFDKQETYTLHKPARKIFPRNKVKVGFMDMEWDADLMDVQNLSRQKRFDIHWS